MIRNLKDLIIFENYCLRSNLIIILGANINEKHIIEFAKRQISNYHIWCISSESIEMENEINNVSLKQFTFDFNNVDKWIDISKLIEENFTLEKIIVDWSTAKFFKDGFNFYIGNIMEIIKNFMNIHNTEFYSPCCYEAVIYEEDFSKGEPLTYNYYTPDTSTYPGIFLRNESSRYFINKNYIEEFNNFIKYYMDNKYKSTYYTESMEDYVEYPLKREGDQKIKDYMIITKN